MNSSLRSWVGLLALALCGSAASGAYAQCASCGETAVYKIVCQTVYEERQVTAYKQECETVMDQVEVTRQVPVWETQARERRFTVLKPVSETSMREERYTVQRPVYETVMRDASYNVVRNVSETSEREERFVVQRPVTETVMREERYVVQRPVTETVQQTQYRTVMSPVTTYTTQYADQGCFQDQVSLRAGDQILAAACLGPAADVLRSGHRRRDHRPRRPGLGADHNARHPGRQPRLEAERRCCASAADVVRRPAGGRVCAGASL